MKNNTDDNWQKLGDVTNKIVDRLAPVYFPINLNGPLADALRREAARVGKRPETIIAEAVRAYMGDAA